jgi:hypothetical protein
MYAAMPQCENIIFGGHHENHYDNLFSGLERENLNPGKVIFLYPSATSNFGNLSPSFPRRLSFGELFMSRRVEIGKPYAQVVARERSTSPVAAGGWQTIPRKNSSAALSKIAEPTLGAFLFISFANKRCLVECQKSFSACMQHVLSQPTQMLQT